MKDWNRAANQKPPNCTQKNETKKKKGKSVTELQHCSAHSAFKVEVSSCATCVEYSHSLQCIRFVCCWSVFQPLIQEAFHYTVWPFCEIVPPAGLHTTVSLNRFTYLNRIYLLGFWWRIITKRWTEVSNYCSVYTSWFLFALNSLSSVKGENIWCCVLTFNTSSSIHKAEIELLGLHQPRMVDLREWRLTSRRQRQGFFLQSIHSSSGGFNDPIKSKIKLHRSEMTRMRHKSCPNLVDGSTS